MFPTGTEIQQTPKQDNLAVVSNSVLRDLGLGSIFCFIFLCIIDNRGLANRGHHHQHTRAPHRTGLLPLFMIAGYLLSISPSITACPSTTSSHSDPSSLYPSCPSGTRASNRLDGLRQDGYR
ncbi:hypothetical protein B0T18DRAFT_175544 [Schizothecium vesticola]|uniref:Uncharacterized protein n=1 Tax=Schizothecium vesticola TaxID=314040 RepID=A0AA40EPJ4_9PEZI|nr:hypothetical protein B0T18DRAFT_175544 [Schizothecium vesticola]